MELFSFLRGISNKKGWRHISIWLYKGIEQGKVAYGCYIARNKYYMSDLITDLINSKIIGVSIKDDTQIVLNRGCEKQNVRNYIKY